jgi:hypothetical protein
LLERIRAATTTPGHRQSEVLALRTLFDRLARHAEGWFSPYLVDGFKTTRETGGMDLFGRWSRSVL